MKRTFFVLVWVIALVLLLARDITVSFAASPGSRLPVAVNEPSSQQPGSDSPGSDSPGSDSPGSDSPGSDSPGSDSPAPAPPAPVTAAVTAGGAEAAAATAVATTAAAFPSIIPIALDAMGAHSVQAVDIDLDGDLDVISASRNDGRIIWFENLGGAAPGFSAHVLAVALGSYMAIPADLNRDGWPDLAVAAVGILEPSAAAADSPAPVNAGQENAAATGKLFWLQNRLGSKQSFVARTVAEGLNYPVAVHPVDLNGDGLPDLVSPTRDDGKITWYENRSGGDSFIPHVVAAGLVGAVAVHSGDIDGDGKPDIIAAVEDTNRILWFRNNGAAAPAFEPHDVRNGPPPPPTLDYAKSVFAADVDGDGDLDIAYASEQQNQVGWYENLGRGGSFSEHVLASNLGHAKSVYVIDVDQDGDQDILAAASDSGAYLFENKRGNPPTFAVQTINSTLLGARSVFAADINGDGALDLLTASRDDNKVLLYPSLASHRTALFASQAQYVVNTYIEPRMAVAADLNNDGRLDIVSVSDAILAWHRNDGGTPPTFTKFVVKDGLAGGRWVHAVDIDGDGDRDLFVADTTANRIYWFENLLSTPGAAPGFAEHLVSDQVVGPRDVRSAEINGDGLLDLYSANDGDNTITWFRQRRTPGVSFERRVVTINTRYARSSYAVDLTQDGRPDLMSASADDGMVAWYKNEGGDIPSWTQQVLTRGMPGARHIYAADINRDGTPDIIAGAEINSTIAWYANNGGATPSFVERIVSRTASGVHAVTAADLDRDGDLDLVAALEAGNRIVWYENAGGAAPQFVEHAITDNFPVAHSVSVADVDGDGDLDVIATARGGGQVAWFENVGGQFSAFQNGAQAPVGGRQVLADVVLTHKGRAGDANLRANALTIRMTASGQPLSSAEAAALFSNIAVYHDSNYNGALDAPDVLVASLDGFSLDGSGQLLIPLDPSKPNVQIAPGGSSRFFVTGQTRTGGCVPSGSLQVKHVVNSLTAVNGVTGASLRAEFMGNMDVLSAPSDTTRTAVVINELMPDNTHTLEDPDEPQEYPDWIELYNPGRSTVDLGGMFLSDDPANPQLFRIPDGIKIAAKGYLVFIADGEPSQGPLHTTFRLSKGGESVILIDKESNGFRLLDQVTYDGMDADVSYGRDPNHSGVWRTMGAATPGGYNLDTRLVINTLTHLPYISSGAVCR